MDQILLVKIISALLYPLGIVFVLLIMVGVFLLFGWRKTASSLKFCSVVILLLASNSMFAGHLLQSLEQRYPQQELASISKHDAILVLGGGLQIPLAPALRSQIGWGSDRYWHAVLLYRAGKADKIILSGGNVFAQQGVQGEAYYAAELLQQWGVPQSKIIVETSSRTTSQNLANTERFFETGEISSMLLVTSAYHMPRAMAGLNQSQIKITPASADVLVLSTATPDIMKWIPSVGALKLTTTAVHEYYGIWFANLKALIANGW